MDRMEFLNQIKFECDNDLGCIMSGFFDQYMLLYDLVDTVENVVVLDTYDNNGIKFLLTYSNIVSSAKLAEKLSVNPYVIIYEKQYGISFSLLNNQVAITITRI